MEGDEDKGFDFGGDDAGADNQFFDHRARINDPSNFEREELEKQSRLDIQ